MNVGPGGRDHKYGAFPKSNAVHPFDLIATVYHAVGVDPGLQVLDAMNRPRRLVDHGEPILGLFS
jgi:hypothetical protein